MVNLLIKILIDGCIFSSYPHGGIARYFREILKRITFNNKNINFYVMCDEQSHEHLPEHPQIQPIFFRSLAFRPSLIFHYLDDWRQRRFNQAIVDLSPHVFHSTYYTLPPFSGMKTVTTVYDLIDHQFPLMHPNGFGFVERQRKVLNTADRVISISRSTTDLAIKAFGINPLKIETVVLGANEKFIPANEYEKTLFRNRFTNGQPYFLFVGAMGGYKNLTTVIRAFAQVVEKSGHLLVLAGHSMQSIEPWIIDLAIQCRVEEKIIVLHHPRDEVLATAYSAASAFIFPSLLEGFGIPLLEAMQCDCKVIASDIPVFREVCENAALYFDPHNASELAGAMLNVLASDDGDHARTFRQSRLSHFSWDVAAKKIENIYLELAGQAA